METSANTAQAQAWNGDEGQHWIANRDRYAAMHRQLTVRLLAAAAIEPGDTVLDIGCGCGGTAISAAERARPGRVVGVDLSEPMLAEARRQAAKDELANVDFVAADVQVHPFPAAGFDVAVSHFGLTFFADPAAAFANIGAALRPGGRLAFLCWQEFRRNEFLTVPLGAVATHVPPPAPGGNGPGGFSLADPDLTRDLLTGAGFVDVTVESITERLRLGDVVHYLLSTPAARSMAAAGDERTAAAVTDTLREALRPFQTDEGVHLGGAAWLVTARRPPSSPR